LISTSSPALTMGILSSSTECPARPAHVKGQAIAGSLTFQHLITILSWACFGVSTLLWLSSIIPHLRRYKAPNEQRQIFRIVSTPLIFTIIAAISAHVYDAGVYLAPVANLYEAFALASLFLLYVQYISPDATTRDQFFRLLEYKGKQANDTGSLRWFWNTWRTVFLYVVVYAVLVIIQEVTMATGSYCSTSSKPRFAHIWIQALELISTICAIVAVIRFQRRLREHMTGRRALAKLVMFKSFVLVTTLQNFVFSILRSKVTGSSKITYDDITIGVPALLICVEAVIFMAANLFVFNIKEYRNSKEQTGRDYSIMQALLNALNPMDLIRGIVQAFGSFRARTSTQG